MQTIYKSIFPVTYFKTSFQIFGVAFFLILFQGCKNDEISEKEIELADSLSIKLNSTELKKINAELLENPSSAELYNKRSKVYIQYKQYDEAIGDAKRAIIIDSTNADYYITLADAYFAQNKTRNTKEVLERTVTKFPENTNALMKLSELYFIVKQYQNAIDNINKALKINENLANAYYLKGSIYRESGDTTKAISSLETTVEQDNSFLDAYYDLGVIYSARKNPLALDYFNNVLRINPNHIEANYAKAKLLQDLEKYDEALEQYKYLSNIDKDNLQSLYNSGAIYLDIKNNYELAIEFFSKCISINSNWAAPYFGRGYAHAKLGDKSKAKEDYETCLKIDPEFSSAKIGLRELK
ncbi:MAG: tetratricopeptide repeat protein [Bacteroidia bacterium]